MKKTVIALAAIALGAGLVFWLYGSEQADLPGVDLARAYAAAQVRIERLRKPAEGPVDWDAIAKQFEIALPIVRRIDQAHGLNYARQIPAALGKCVTGNRPDVNQQVLAKGLQHVTVLAIRGELATLAGAAGLDRRAAAARAVALFEGIRPTFTRRDKDLFPGANTLTAAAEAGLKQIDAAGRNDDAVGAGRELERAIARTYALSVLYEVQEIERLRASDRAACDVKRAEAIIFYRIIYDRIKMRDETTAATLLTYLINTDFDKMEAGAVEAALRKGLGNIPLVQP